VVSVEVGGDDRGLTVGRAFDVSAAERVDDG
jgi:hypothetical protein